MVVIRTPFQYCFDISFEKRNVTGWVRCWEHLNIGDKVEVKCRDGVFCGETTGDDKDVYFLTGKYYIQE